MTRADAPRLRRWLERALLGCGIACASWVGQVLVQEASYQRTHRSAVEQWSAQLLDQPSASLRAHALTASNGTIGVLEIPRLGFSEVVAEGADDATLRVAIGHLPDTPLPWAEGNSAFAGHRDTHFMALREILVGDRLRLKTARGDLEYLVDERVIVSPDDVSVLMSTGGRTLTLVTCYPFSYIGRAPQRFIVHAKQVAPEGG